ncbi:MAG: hypothetical protein Kow0042_28220 [Calditrichia bacterium]
MRNILFLLIFLFGIENGSLFAAGESPSYYRMFKGRPAKFDWVKCSLSGGLILGSVSAVYLSTRDIYYNEPTVKFHFARHSNGSLKWFENKFRGMDKFGHIFSGSLYTQNIYFLARWSGMEHKSASYAAFWGSFTVMSAMEVHDAFYERWGFSLGDFTANLIGAVYPLIQQNSQFFQAIDYKFSYHLPILFSHQEDIDDYENMTFWLTLHPGGLFSEKLPGWFPKFLNVAVGVVLSHYPRRQREIYLSLDYNLKYFRAKSLFLSYLLAMLDRFHLPAPAIRITPTVITYGLFF